MTTSASHTFQGIRVASIEWRLTASGAALWRPEASPRPGAARRRRMEATPEGREALAEAGRMVAGMLRREGIARLAALRLQAGLSQDEVARRVGILQPHLSRIENGRVEPEIPTMQKLAEAYGVSLGAVAEAAAATLDAAKGRGE